MDGFAPERGARAAEPAVATLFGLWLVAGAGLDAWAHTAGRAETFWTPWHAVLYSGFLASAAWLLARGVDRSGARAAVRPGFGAGLAGIAVFGAGGFGDLAWHQVFGIERTFDATLSPTHLLLFAGAIMILTHPLRVVPRDAGVTLPVLMAVAMTTALATLLLFYASPFVYRDVLAGFPPGQEFLASGWQRAGILSFLAMTLILTTPAVVLIRRGGVPPGAFTLLFGIVATMSWAVSGASDAVSILPLGAGGIAGDVLYAVLRPDAARAPRAWAFCASITALVWSLYVVVIVASGGSLQWDVDVWAGAIVLSTGASAGLAMLALPGR